MENDVSLAMTLLPLKAVSTFHFAQLYPSKNFFNMGKNLL